MKKETIFESIQMGTMENKNQIEIKEGKVYINEIFFDAFVEKEKHKSNNKFLRIKNCVFLEMLFNASISLENSNLTLSPTYTDCPNFMTERGDYDAYSATEYLFPIVLERLRALLGKEVSFEKHGNDDEFGSYTFKNGDLIAKCIGLNEGRGFNILIRSEGTAQNG